MILYFNAVIRQRRKIERRKEYNRPNLQNRHKNEKQSLFQPLGIGNVAWVTLQGFQALLLTAQVLQQEEILTKLCGMFAYMSEREDFQEEKCISEKHKFKVLKYY